MLLLTQCFFLGRYRAKQFYESEILKGHIKLHIDKVVVYGIAGSGKISALAAMLGRDPDTIQSSTPLIRESYVPPSDEPQTAHTLGRR